MPPGGARFYTCGCPTRCSPASGTTGAKVLGHSVRWFGGGLKLLHDRGAVEDGEIFLNQPVPDPVHVDGVNAHASSRRWHPHELAVVGAEEQRMGHHTVAFCDLLLYLRPKVGEPIENPREELPNAFTSMERLWHEWHANNRVFCEYGTDCLQVVARDRICPTLYDELVEVLSYRPSLNPRLTSRGVVRG